MLKFIFSTLFFPFFEKLYKIIRVPALFYLVFFTFLSAFVTYFYLILVEQGRPFFWFHFNYSAPLVKHIFEICREERLILDKLMVNYKVVVSDTAQTSVAVYLMIAVGCVLVVGLTYSFYKRLQMVDMPPLPKPKPSSNKDLIDMAPPRPISRVPPEILHNLEPHPSTHFSNFVTEPPVPRGSNVMELPNARPYYIYSADPETTKVCWTDPITKITYLYRTPSELTSFPQKTTPYSFMFDAWEVVLYPAGLIKHQLIDFGRIVRPRAIADVFRLRVGPLTPTWRINKTYPPYGSSMAPGQLPPLPISSLPISSLPISSLPISSLPISSLWASRTFVSESIVMPFATIITGFLGFKVAGYISSLPVELVTDPVFADFAPRVLQQYMALQPNFSFESLKDCFFFEGSWSEYVAAKSEIGRKFVEDYLKFRPYIDDPDGSSKAMEVFRAAKTKQK